MVTPHVFNYCDISYGMLQCWSKTFNNNKILLNFNNIILYSYKHIFTICYVLLQYQHKCDVSDHMLDTFPQYDSNSLKHKTIFIPNTE